VTQTAPQFHALCRWAFEAIRPRAFHQFMTTDSIAVLKHGVDLGLRTWSAFLRKLGWMKDQIDKVICHQVGSGHRDTVLKALGIAEEKDFSTLPANRQLIAQYGGSFFRHLITPTNIRRNRHIRR
jgi:acyl-CoA:acyl-CoA alkyltransferase